MAKRIAIIEGHPDPDPDHLGHALAGAYAEGARSAGHEVRSIAVAALDFPLLRTSDDFEHGTPPPSISDAQQTLAWADHIVVLYPLWLGDMPALLKAFLEQTLRPGFLRSSGKLDMFGKGALTGKSARIIVTMGMPALVYYWYFGAHSLKSLERNILRFSGMKSVRSTVLGGIGNVAARRTKRLIAMMQKLGHACR